MTKSEGESRFVSRYLGLNASEYLLFPWWRVLFSVVGVLTLGLNASEYLLFTWWSGLFSVVVVLTLGLACTCPLLLPNASLRKAAREYCGGEACPSV